MNQTHTTDLEKVARALDANERFVVTTHENPDGDALGSLLATSLALRALGKEANMYLAGNVPFPREYLFMPLTEVRRGPAPAMDGRVLVAVDCANERRLGAEYQELLDGARLVVNVDHHHDNTRFGAIDHAVPEASCTAEIVWDLMRALGVEATPEIADALYVGLVTDTGKLMYENTGTRAHVMAA